MPDLYGISAALIARLLGCSIETARRYKRTGRMPAVKARLLEIRLTGELGFVDTAWHGFKLVRGELVTPEGSAVRPGEIRSIPYRRLQVAELERMLAEPRQRELFD